MKRFFVLFGLLFCTAVFADTVTVNWDMNDQTYATTTCESGDDITLPQTTPTKRGYTFQGWKLLSYIPLEYIENIPSDTYFNTGFYPTENTKVVVDFIKPSYGSGDCPVIKTTSILFGISSSINSNYPLMPSFYFNKKRFYKSEKITNVRHKYSLDKNAWYMDDVKAQDINQQDAYFRSDAPMYIFSSSDSDPTTCVIRIYSIQLYQDDVLVHDYVPAMKSDGTVCFYDKVTGTFLYNQGTSDPVAGPAL